MRQQTVVSHPDAHIDRHHPKSEKAEEGFPGKHEEGNHSEHMERHHKAGGHPVCLIRLSVSSKYWHVALWPRAPRLAGPQVDCVGRSNNGGGWGGLYNF